MQRERPTAAVIGFVAVIAVSAALGCVILPDIQPVGPNFDVEVRDWKGHLIQAAEIRLTPFSAAGMISDLVPGDVTLTLRTDAQGSVRFSEVPPGVYELSVLRRDSDVKFVNVVATGSKRKIQLDWPHLPVLTARVMRGRLLTSGLGLRLHVALITGSSEEEVATTETDSLGRFEFPTTSPGLHFLKVWYPADRRDEFGDVAIDIEPEANANELHAELQFTDCGLKYIDAQKCAPAVPIEVGSICGDITDGMGAVVRKDVSLELMNDQPGAAATLVTSVTPTQIGTFEMTAVRSGRYKLLVSAPGFFGLEVPLNVTSALKTGRCEQPLHIVLGTWDQCSKAEMNPHK